MEISGEYRIAAPCEEVWRRLMDPEVLRDCIPGCKELNRNGEYSYDAKVQLKIGPVSATFAAAVEMQDIDAPRGCLLVGKGNGGIAGFAKGQCKVNLAETDAGTLLTYRAETEIGGKIAALGSRLMQATSRKLADQFFAALSKQVT
jgi:carbon monoxide dehydrogenase subunit G